MVGLATDLNGNGKFSPRQASMRGSVGAQESCNAIPIAIMTSCRRGRYRLINFARARHAYRRAAPFPFRCDFGPTACRAPGEIAVRKQIVCNFSRRQIWQI